MRNKTVLFMGRFQPLHYGHLKVLQQLCKEYKKVIIGIGSINKLDDRNPFSFEQRKEMVQRVLKDRRNFQVIGFPDFPSDKKWIENIEKQAKFDVVVSGNMRVRDCLKKYDLKMPKFYKRNSHISTKIRKMFGTDKWKKFVPKEIHDIVSSRGFDVIKTDVLVIGSGGAGLRAAIESHDKGLKVLVIGRSFLGKAHTRQAEGGINAALGSLDKKDNWMVHAYDTLKEGCFLGDSKLVQTLTKEAPKGIFELQKWGMPFDKINGKISQRFFGAHTYRRTCYVGDRTGLFLLNALVKQIEKRKIESLDNFLVTSLIKSENSARGATVVNLSTGKFFIIDCNSVILATGGHSRIYRRTSTPEESYGDGIALAYNIGAKLMDMEMMQFHPTGMVWPRKAAGFLVTEAVRGEGGRLYNALGERFMKKYDPERMELSARDIVARAIYTEIAEGRGTKNDGVLLDISHVDPKIIRDKLPKMCEQMLKYNKIDLTKKPVEVAPTTHYAMGGIVINEKAETSVKGLFACGEVASGIHGANRLGGNSLLDTQVFGKVAGSSAASYSKKIRPKKINYSSVSLEYKRLQEPFKRKKGFVSSEIKKEIQDIMWQYAGIVKDEKNLRLCMKKLHKVKNKIEKISLKGTFAGNTQWQDFVEVSNMIITAEMITRGALIRKESRGAHYRTDYKETKNEYLFNIIFQKNKDKITKRKVPKVSGPLKSWLEKNSHVKQKYGFVE